MVRADNEPVGEFTTSVELINDIHTIIDRAVQGNMYSVLTDCPHREKLGWLEETHLLFDVIAYNYDVAAYYRELLVTIAEAQTEDGLVPDIAPEYVVFADGFRDDPNWGSAIIQVPWQHYRWYGDAAVLEDHYPAMVRYLDYLTGRSEDGLLTYGLGDWITTDRTTPVPLVGTWGYWRAASAMIDIAAALGRTDDADRFRALATKISTAFGTAFLDPATGRYGNGGQASEILALDVGAVPPEEVDTVLDRLCDSVDDGLNVGEIALPAVFRVLGEAGRHDALWRFANATEHPSYGYQVRHGATSLTEAWDGPTRGLSQNHFMLGAIDSWFYRHLAGIDQTAGSVGWRTLEIAPVIVDGLDSVTARTRGARGDIAVSWQRSEQTFRLQVEIPAGSTATVRLPALAGTTAVAPPEPRDRSSPRPTAVPASRCRPAGGSSSSADRSWSLMISGPAGRSALPSQESRTDARRADAVRIRGSRGDHGGHRDRDECGGRRSARGEPVAPRPRRRPGVGRAISERPGLRQQPRRGRAGGRDHHRRPAAGRPRGAE